MAGLAWTLLSGQMGEPSPSRPLFVTGKSPDLMLFYTGDVIGYIDHCGCPKNPAGGLGRRAWALEQLRNAFPDVPRILLDSGNFSDNPTPAGELRTRALLEAMGRLGYAAANVGERDLLLGYEDLSKKVEGLPFPLLSTNVVRQGTLEPIFRPYVVLEAVRRAGQPPLRVGVLGVVRYNPLFQKSGPGKSSMVIASPRAMLARFVPEVRQKADLVVLLATLQQDDAHALARDVPGIDMILGTYGGYVSAPDVTEGTTRILYAGNQGKELVETRLYFTGPKLAKAVSYMHTLDARYHDDPQMLQYQADVQKRVSALGDTEQPAASGSGRSPYAGAAACASCHASEHAQWRTTAHAAAFARVAGTKKEEDLSCLTCHATGAGEEGGFRNSASSPELIGVTCESCHGPGAEHAAQPAKGFGKTEIATCIACHNRENSPKFDYAAYLPKVLHGAAEGSRAGSPATSAP